MNDPLMIQSSSVPQIEESLIPKVEIHPETEPQEDSHPKVALSPSAIPLSDGIRLLERIVFLVRDKGGSDIHLLEGERPRVRVRGNLLPVESDDHPLVLRKDIQDILNYALTPKQKQTFEETADIDFSLDFHEATGRVNVGLANGHRLYLTMRYLRSNIIPLDQLGIDVDMLKKLIAADSGLIIVAGETSSGKTTTIVAMLDYINHTRLGAIATIENPVEYVLHSDKCLITRREIGRDTPNFNNALRSIVRKNPDILLIGEIRDVETATITLNAAETGIQTFCTLHAVSAISAITRLGYIMIGGGHNETEFHQRLSNILCGIISQELVKASDDKSVLPVFEILNMSYSEKSYLRARDFIRLEQSLDTDRNYSLGRCLYNLWYQKPRRINEATIRLLFPDQFNLMMNRLDDHDGWKPLVTSMG
ncbi:Flp pilus assembly complex ATPase component TadA [Candidatus Sumerlaeota bacterium]|nr:Flp pilus assembly complex ATPase component TadA [Candidatus Sumerlaeota bacterium]